MGWLNSKETKVYCAFCKSQRNVRLKKHVGFKEFALALAAAILLMFLFFQNFDFRIIPILAILVCGFEWLVQMRYRLNLVCKHCGFDPLLYMRSNEKACQRVQEHLEKRKADPMTILTSKPKLDLPILKKNTQKNLQKAQRLDVRL